MNIIEKIARRPAVSAALAEFYHRQEQVVQQAIEVQQHPAPTFAEQVRAGFVQQRFVELGLQDVTVDQWPNVYGRFPGREPQRPPVIVSAHTDTVFPAGTDLTIRRDKQLVYGPGLADNSLGVAGLFELVQTLTRHQIQPLSDVWFVANMGEEGLGDLKGMRAVVERFGGRAFYLVLEGGSFGHVVHRAVGSQRFRIEVQAQGGHSWSDFGQSSAIHILGRLIADIDQLKLPPKPKASYNVGMIEGGTSINTIAARASLQLDLRCEGSNEQLTQLVGQVQKMVQKYDNRPGVKLLMQEIGNRPAGELPADSRLVQWAASALEWVGFRPVRYGASSTDANIPLSLGYEAVCIGLADSGNVHRTDEFLDPTPLPRGLGQLLLLTLACSEA